MERCRMNKRNSFVFIGGLAVLTVHNSTSETPPEPIECVLAVMNNFASHGGKEESFYKHIHDCDLVEYRNEIGGVP